jgi:hypothetical protein
MRASPDSQAGSGLLCVHDVDVDVGLRSRCPAGRRPGEHDRENAWIVAVKYLVERLL